MSEWEMRLQKSTEGALEISALFDSTLPTMTIVVEPDHIDDFLVMLRDVKINAGIENLMAFNALDAEGVENEDLALCVFGDHDSVVLAFCDRNLATIPENSLGCLCYGNLNEQTLDEFIYAIRYELNDDEFWTLVTYKSLIPNIPDSDLQKLLDISGDSYGVMVDGDSSEECALVDRIALMVQNDYPGGELSEEETHHILHRMFRAGMQYSVDYGGASSDPLSAFRGFVDNELDIGDGDGESD